MAYIYQITNDINDKVYVGKTEFDIAKRFKEHCEDAFSRQCEKRPLYAAMRKYGIGHFSVSLIEETSNPEDRERFWIEEKGSFKKGYNATKGGDGRPYLDHDLLIATYSQTQSVAEAARICGCDKDQLSKILHLHNITVHSHGDVSLKKYGKVVNQYDIQGHYLRSFPSIQAAAKAIKPNYNNHGIAGHISAVCRGKRKTAYGFKWEYAENFQQCD